tara:strand:+ start:175 stop:1584 length:1410 start_codon:yes stop_codon:yes gene_type:complete
MPGILEFIGNTLEKGVGGAEKLGSGIGTLLAQLGENYTGPDTGGMELTDQQRRGLFQAQLRDSRYGPAATSGNVDAFLERARGNQSIASMRSAIDSIPGISQEDKDLINALPPAEKMKLVQSMMESKFAPNNVTAPSAVRQYEYYQALPTEQEKSDFMATIRNPYLNRGDAFVNAYDPTDEIPMQFAPGESPDDQARAAEAVTLAETGLNTVLTPAERQVDNAFAGIFAEYEFNGGREGAQRNLNVMAEALTELQASLSPEEQAEVFNIDPNKEPERIIQSDDRQNYSGPFLGMNPTEGPFSLGRRLVNSKSIDMADTIAGVIQQGLRDTLGAQFAEREGALMIRRAYDDNQEEAVNIKRLMPLFNLFKRGVEERNRQADFYRKTGSMQNYETNQDFDLLTLDGQEGFLNQLKENLPADQNTFDDVGGLSEDQKARLADGEELSDSEYSALSETQLNRIISIQDRLGDE